MSKYQLTRKTKPSAATWRTAKLFDVNLYHHKAPLCGQRLIWVIVGRKWVRFHSTIGNIKFKLRKSDWDAISYKVEIA